MRAASRRRLLWVLALLLVAVAGTLIMLLPAPGDGPGDASPLRYVGSRTCEECHAEEAQRWRGSHHDLAMQEASARSVLGDFADARFTHGSSTSRLFRKSGQYRVRTDGPDGRPGEFVIAYTFGLDPFQQYLVAMRGGRFQVLGVAWDSRPAAAGGRRWFATHEDAVGYRHPRHWTKPSQNWNSRCAECHSTNVRKGYRPRDDLFLTTFSEIDVACEACHGAGSRHVDWARASRARGRSAGREPGLIARFAERRERKWEMDPARGTARLARAVDATAEVETCARCHATRELLDEAAAPGQLLQQTHRPALLDEGLYFADGQPRAEPFTWGSFVQGRMYAAGVSCVDCHDAHDLTLRAEGDQVCLACHAAERFASRRHHFHRENGSGASCVGCHMVSGSAAPAGRRHDHAFRVPRPDVTVSLGAEQAPNACNGCHRERTPRWAAQAVRRWYPEGRGLRAHFAEALHAGRSRAPGALQALAALVRDVQQPAIARATAVSLLSDPGSSATLPLLQKAAADPEPLVRMAAASRLSTLPAGERVRAGVTLLWDPVLAVRVEAVPAFAEVPDAAFASEQRAAFDRALDDFYTAQRVNSERPEAHVRLGLVHASRGRAKEARRDFDTALRLSPGHEQASVGLAELLRAQGRLGEAEAVLRSAIWANPQGVAARRAFARLLRADRRRSAEALRALQRAVELAPADAALAREYAEALRAAGQPEESLAVLRAAQRQAAGSRELLLALAKGTRDAGRDREAREWTGRLLASFPADPEGSSLAAELGMTPDPVAAAGASEAIAKARP